MDAGRESAKLTFPRLIFLLPAFGLSLFVILAVTRTPINIPKYLPPAQTVTDSSAMLEEITYPRFIDRTIEKRLFTEHRQRSDHLIGLNEVIGGGVCTLDYDQDGWLDLVVVGGSGIGHHYGRQQWWQTGTGTVLYRNIQGQHFEPDPEAIPPRAEWGMTCTAEDFDNDGDTDLFFANSGENRLLENSGGHFTEVSRNNFFDKNNWTTKALAGDFNQDGLVDLYLINYLDYSPQKKYLEQSSAFTGPSDSLFNPALFEPVQNQLLMNLGQLEFEDVTENAGVSNISGRGINGKWFDIDKDNHLDLIVVNDAESASQVFINEGNGRFRNNAREFGLGGSHATYSLSFGDVFGDSSPEILIGGNSTTNFSVLTKGSDNQVKEISARLGFETYPESTRSIDVEDFNNDGLPDIYLSNGIAYPDIDSNSHAQAQANRLFLNKGNDHFTECSEACFPEYQIPVSNRNTVVADFDKDGDLDIYEAVNNGLGRYWENQLVNSEGRLPTSIIQLESAEGKLAVAQWMIEDNRWEEAVHELGLLTRITNTEIADQAITSLSAIRQQSSLLPLISALQDSRPEIRLASVRALREQEVDFTGRYLIPLLSDSNEQVQCETARAFSFFFDEEEAMIRLKYLAKPVLARLVQSNAALPCLIEALGKSESYRGLDPLVKLAADGNTAQRMAALDALGLIKEQASVPYLRSVSMDANGQDIVRAAANRALARLEQTSLELLTSGEQIPKADVSKSDLEEESVRAAYQNGPAQIRRLIRERALDLDEPLSTRLAIIRSFLPEVLLSEYRLSLQIAANQADPLRYRAVEILLAYNSEEHLNEYLSLLHSEHLSDTEKLTLAEAMRPYAADQVWNALLR